VTSDTGSPQQITPLPPTQRTLVFVSMGLLLGGGLVAAETVVWMAAAAHKPSNDTAMRVVLGSPAVALFGVAGKKFFWDALRTRRRRWNRTSAVLTLLAAAYMVVLAIRGP
jgi:Ca2+/Na+ antiporter